MKTTIAILICKFITFVEKIFGFDASVFPGSIAKKIDKNILKKIKYPKYVIAVTGSSGKGSTVNALAHILKTNNKKIIYNASGSNINNGVITLILNNSKIFSHKLNTDILLLEMDERYISKSLDKGIITHMLITNVTRDQPARNYHEEVIFNKIMEAVSDDIHMFINVDDPLLNRIKYIHKGKITTYGVDKTKYDLNKTPNYPIDFAYCPKCNSKLIYKAYHYGNQGLYKCPNCDFERGKPDYEAKDINLEKGIIKVNNKTYKLDKQVFFAIYYTLGAIAISKEINITDKELDYALNKKTIKPHRKEIYKLDNRTFETVESKNENNLSYVQSINYITSKKGTKTLIMGFDDISRRYNYNDLSWLWDVNYEDLNDDSIDKIYCIGIYRYDVALRLKYAGIKDEKIIIIDKLNKLIENVKQNSKGNIYSMVFLDMEQQLLKLIKEDQK